MNKTVIIWHRLGKEHGEKQGFRVNTQEMIDAHISTKLQKIANHDPSDWRWWQINDELLIEKPIVGFGYGNNTVIYYLPKKNWAIIKNIEFPGLERWLWYIHIAKIEFYNDIKAWILTDMFVDVLVEKDNISHTVLDLDDLANAMEIGLISQQQLKETLNSSQELLNLIQKGGFPPKSIIENKEYVKGI
jgi:hypothetical protein